jgi:hypothetical protein
VCSWCMASAIFSTALRTRLAPRFTVPDRGELMVTATQLSRLDAKLDALAAAIDTDCQPIIGVVYSGETREYAAPAARELRPDHAGRSARFEYRNEERDDVREMFAVHTPEELQPVLDHIDAKGRGLTIGQRMLRDARPQSPMLINFATGRMPVRPAAPLRCDGSLAQFNRDGWDGRSRHPTRASMRQSSRLICAMGHLTRHAVMPSCMMTVLPVARLMTRPLRS